MTGLEVERTPRTACPLPSGSPTGLSAPLPPFIQKAERPTESRARHTGLRWGLRVLVVGGLAGAAWLLTGAAAHAADRADGPIGSLLGSVVEGDTTAPVTGLLKAAAQPLETGRPAHHKRTVVTDVLDVPRRVLTRPAETLDEVVHGHHRTPVDAAIGDLDQVLREAADPIRLTGGPAATRPRPSTATAPVASDPRPADERPQLPAVAPVPAAADPEPVAAGSRTPIVPTAQRRGTALRAPVSAQRAVPVKPGKVASRSHVHRHRAAIPAVTAEPATTAHDKSTPGGDGPAAPLRLHLGDVSGTPAGWPGAPTEGGSAAFLPATIASSTMASQRLLFASDVEVRRYDAEAPTVSPD